MNELPVEIGDKTEFSKTITDADLALFAAVSGDFDPIHMNDEFARKSPFGRRIAHGILVLALLSAAESEMSTRIAARATGKKPVSLGYDRIRFIHPVFIGDTLTARYTIADIDQARDRSSGNCEVFNQDGILCIAGTHIMKWIAV